MTDQVNGTRSDQAGVADKSPDTPSKAEKVEAMEEVQKDAAKQRDEVGGYQ